ncbi:hypothetical protein D3C75_569970 [compost metagenome]
MLQLLVQDIDRLVQHILIKGDGVALHRPRSNRIGPKAGDGDAEYRQRGKGQPYSLLQRGPVKPILQHVFTPFLNSRPEPPALTLALYGARSHLHERFIGEDIDNNHRQHGQTCAGEH